MRVRKRDRHIGKKCGKDAIVFIHSRHSSLKISHGCEITLVREQAICGSVQLQNRVQTFAFDERVVDMPYNQNVQSIGLADEPNMGLPAPASDNHESSETADDVIDSLCSSLRGLNISG
jgi:hypothetical protein